MSYPLDIQPEYDRDELEAELTVIVAILNEQCEKLKEVRFDAENRIAHLEGHIHWLKFRRDHTLGLLEGGEA